MKWSVTNPHGVKFAKVLTRLLIKLEKLTDEKKNPEGYDLDKTIERLSKIGYCLNIKVGIAHKTELEDRVKYLEGLNKPKQIHEAYNTK